VDIVNLADGGPVVILLAGIGTLFLAFVRGDIVPGYIYRQERDWRRIAETQAERNSESIAMLAKFADARRSDA